MNYSAHSAFSNVPYSPDLTPLEYFLFTNLKKSLVGQRFANNDEVDFEEFDGSYYKQGIEAIEHRWEKCITSQGGYVEK